MNWPHAAFEIPDNIQSAWRTAGKHNINSYDDWQARLAAADTERRCEFLRTTAGELPAGWQDDFTAFKKRLAEEQPTMATRKASGEALNVLTSSINELIGGSADDIWEITLLTRGSERL